MRFSVFTIATPDFLAFAITLMESVRAHQPDAKRTIFVIAETLDGVETPEGLAEWVVTGAMEIADYRRMTFAYTPFELSCALKPAAFAWLMARRSPDVEAYVMLDSDIQLFAPLTPVARALERAALTLTPHATVPKLEQDPPDDLDLLRSGLFNGGFLALRPTPETRAFIAWWADRLRTHCLVDLESGLFVDQKWLDLAPSYVPDTALLAGEGCNVGYWNLDEQPIERSAEGWTAGGKPLVFYHFSGIGLEPPFPLSRHRAIERTRDVPHVNALADAYRAALARNGHAAYRRHAYAYGRLADGQPINIAMRGYYRRFMRGADADVVDPFSLPAAYFDAVDEAPEVAGEPPISRVMRGVWLSRADLRHATGLATREGRERFREWFLAYGPGYGVPDPKAPPAAPLPPAPAQATADAATSRELEELRAAHAALAARHAAVIGSSSWRLTAPFRRLFGGARDPDGRP